MLLINNLQLNLPFHVKQTVGLSKLLDVEKLTLIIMGVIPEGDHKSKS